MPKYRVETPKGVYGFESRYSDLPALRRSFKSTFGIAPTSFAPQQFTVRGGKSVFSGSPGSPIGGGGGGGGGGGRPRPKAKSPAQQAIDISRQMQKEQQRAIQPAVEAYQAQIPTIQQQFEQRGEYLTGRQEPLEERYQNIIAEIGRREEQEVGQAQEVLSREYGRRGIPLSSGVFEQTLGEELSPIRRAYATSATEAGLAQEESMAELASQIAGLPLEEQAAINQINQAIAQLQAGGASEATRNALQIYQMQLQAEQAAKDRALQERLASMRVGGGGGGVINLPDFTTGGGGGGGGQYRPGSTFQPEPSPAEQRIREGDKRIKEYGTQQRLQQRLGGVTPSSQPLRLGGYNNLLPTGNLSKYRFTIP